MKKIIGFSFLISAGILSVVFMTQFATPTQAQGVPIDAQNTSAPPQAVAVVNSWVSPTLTANQANGSEFAQYNVFQYQSSIPDSISTLITPVAGGPGQMSRVGPTNMCHHPITIDAAQWIQNRMAEHGINASFLTATSSEFVFLDILHTANCGVASAIGAKGSACIAVIPGPYYAYCTDPGFVSNYPNYIAKYTAFYNSHLNDPQVNSGLPVPFPKSSVPIININNSSNSYVTSGSATSNNSNTSATVTATASTITPYTVSVNYDKFTAESNKYGYTSVYTTTGTKSVSIAVVKLSSGSSLTASQAIASLSTMGYRPATLSEIYALKLAQPSVAIGTLVALGTNLGGSYGYPTGFGGGAAGLGHFAGPFNTNAYKFAAVKE